MFHISELKLSNFKSFKKAHIKLPASFVCFAGPNGSGKSNLCDAIKFALGENSLKSLRVKKIHNLIHSGSKSAYVCLVFQDAEGKKHEIKRQIREDGKVQYSINGKKCTRSAILELLRQYNLDNFGRNIVAQGEVAKIINMSGKERRGIIDAVAGIASFEEKKKEALRELDIVETRIKEAQVVINERKSFLKELEEEKEKAERYLEAKEQVKNVKGSLLKNELNKISQELEKLEQQDQKAKELMEKIEVQKKELEEKINEKEEVREKISKELREKQKLSELIRVRERLLATHAAHEKEIIEKSKQVEELEGEIEIKQNKLTSIKKEVEEIAKELIKSEEKLSSLESMGGVGREELEEKQNKIFSLHEKIKETEKELIKIETEIKNKQDRLNQLAKENKLLEIEDISKKKKELEEIESKIREMFNRTKNINKQISEVDKKLLDLREKATMFKVRSGQSQTWTFIKNLNDPEVVGQVAELIDFNSNYANAIEAAAGNRLFYIVVRSSEGAIRLIEKLKNAKAGRATFIPLDRIVVHKPVEYNQYKSVYEIITCPPEVDRAIMYVFGDTLLVPNVHEAKKIKNMRIVTTNGEIFERSGIISGGKSGGTIAMIQARKINEELESAKSEKERLVQELYRLREIEGELRTERARIEVEIKTIELKEKESTIKRKQVEEEIKELEKSISELKEKKKVLQKEVEKRKAETEQAKNELKELEGKYEEIKEIAAEIAKIKAQIRSKEDEKQEKEIRISEITHELQTLIEKRDSIGKELTKITKDKKEIENRLEEIRKRYANRNSEIEDMFSRLKEIEEEIGKLGAELKKLEEEKQRIEKTIQQNEVKKAVAKTKKEDLTVELSAIGEYIYLEEPREKLIEKLNTYESTLKNLGNVNLAAKEMYEKKREEIEEVEEKINNLEKERRAILEMIDEIEERKKDRFFNCFDEVNRHLKELFKSTNLGEGHLYLDKPRDPFNSGLHIKINRNNREEILDALSGGEKTVVALMFIFALQLYKPSPFYILDEVDAALDKKNSNNFSSLIKDLGKGSQFIVVTHNDTVISNAEKVVGVSKVNGVSKVVGVDLAGIR